MHRYSLKFILFAFFAITFFAYRPDAFAGWEAGIKTGFDTNVNRALTEEKSDSYLTGYLSFAREPARETNLDWALDLLLEGSAYARLNDLNYGMVMLAPGLVYNLHPRWSVYITPFVQVKGVSDADQSAVAFGGKLSMKQQWDQQYYTGQYILYTDSQADIDIYSYEETAAGLFMGVNWTSAFFSEIGYEYARSDSFRSVGEVITSSVGRGRSRGYSQTFHQYVISEPVDRHAVGINVGYNFSRSLFSTISYTYTSYRGDTGNSEAHAASIGLGYRF